MPAGRRLHIDGETHEPDGAVDVRIGIEPAALRFYADLPASADV